MRRTTILMVILLVASVASTLAGEVQKVGDPKQRWCQHGRTYDLFTCSDNQCVKIIGCYNDGYFRRSECESKC
ncbi:hypothetical protein MTO96_038987, partial [Rhipicephalus appendiculatus]